MSTIWHFKVTIDRGKAKTYPTETQYHSNTPHKHHAHPTPKYHTTSFLHLSIPARSLIPPTAPGRLAPSSTPAGGPPGSLSAPKRPVPYRSCHVSIPVRNRLSTAGGGCLIAVADHAGGGGGVVPPAFLAGGTGTSSDSGRRGCRR